MAMSSNFLVLLAISCASSQFPYIGYYSHLPRPQPGSPPQPPRQYSQLAAPPTRYLPVIRIPAIQLQDEYQAVPQGQLTDKVPLLPYETATQSSVQGQPQPAAQQVLSQPSIRPVQTQPAAQQGQPQPFGQGQPQPAVQQVLSQPTVRPVQTQPAAQQGQPQPYVQGQPQPAVQQVLSQPTKRPVQTQPAAQQGQPQSFVKGQPQTAVQSFYTQLAVPQDQPQPAVQSVYPQLAVPQDQPQPAVHSVYPQPALQLDQPQPAVQSVYPQLAVPQDQPQLAVQAVYPQPALQLDQPQPAVHQSQQVLQPQPSRPYDQFYVRQPTHQIYSSPNLSGYQGVLVDFMSPALPVFAPAVEPSETEILPSPVVEPGTRINPTNFNFEEFNHFFENFTRQTVTLHETVTVTLIVPTCVVNKMEVTSLATGVETVLPVQYEQEEGTTLSS